MSLVQVQIIKRAVQRITPAAKLAPRELRARTRDRKPTTLRFKDDGVTPNNKLPLVLYRGVVILPAGTGHQCLGASPDFLVVGAYPPAGTYDECAGAEDEHARALETIPRVARPRKDPAFGPDGELMRLWASTPPRARPTKRAAKSPSPTRTRKRASARRRAA
jgi:hypothetical protein